MILFQKTAAEKTKFEFEQIDENHACLTLQEINFLLLEFERFDFLRRKHYSCNFLCTFEIPLCIQICPQKIRQILQQRQTKISSTPTSLIKYLYRLHRGFLLRQEESIDNRWRLTLA